MDIFSIFFDMNVRCVFSLESPHQGDSDEYTNIPFSIYKKTHPKLSMGFFSMGLKKTARNRCGKRVIRVRATKGLL